MVLQPPLPIGIKLHSFTPKGSSLRTNAPWNTLCDRRHAHVAARPCSDEHPEMRIAQFFADSLGRVSRTPEGVSAHPGVCETSFVMPTRLQTIRLREPAYAGSSPSRPPTSPNIERVAVGIIGASPNSLFSAVVSTLNFPRRPSSACYTACSDEGVLKNWSKSWVGAIDPSRASINATHRSWEGSTSIAERLRVSGGSSSPSQGIQH